MNSMISTIALEYNKKYFNMTSLYTLNLYNIDNEFYIDEDECSKIINWIDDNSECYDGVGYDNGFFEVEHSLINLEKKDSEPKISMDTYLFYTIEKVYNTFYHTVKDYNDIISNLNKFEKPESTEYKQIISENGEIIYIIKINNFDILDGYETHDQVIGLVYSFKLKFNLNEIFNINIKNPLDLEKLINDNNKKKINSNPYI